MMITPTPSQLILMTMLPLKKKATKQGADVDNDVDNVNDNHDE